MATVTYAHAIVKAENIVSFGANGVDQFDPDVIARPDGTFTVAYTDTRANSGHDFVSTHVSEDNIPVNSSGYSPLGEQTTLRVAMLSNGNTLFAGVDALAKDSAGGTSIDTAPFPSSVHKIVGNQYDNQTQPDVVGLTGDRAVIVWTDQVFGSNSNTDIRMTVMNNAGTVIVKDDVAVASTASGERDARVAALTTGGFVVAWTDTSAPLQPKILAQRYDSDGNAVGAKITIDNVGAHASVDIIGLAGGGFAAVYEDTQYGGGRDISLRIFDAAGTAIAGPARIHEASATDEYDPSIAQLSNGYLAVSWMNTAAGNNDLYLRYFTAAGAPLTGDIRFQGTDHDAFNERQSSLAATDDGKLFAAWTDGQVLDAAGTHIGASIFALERATTGDGTGEYLAGDSLQDIINGLGGGDSIVGGVGDDRLFGGDGADFLHANFYGANGLMQAKAGDDTLDGGAGDDGLFGGDGADSMNGGFGNDAMVGGGGNDTMNGGGDADFLFGGAFGASGERLDGSGQDTLFGGAGRDALYGFDDKDSLVGEAGDDYIEGGAGADYINGGSGNDFILGQNDADTIVCSEGFDYLYGGAGGDTFIFRKGDSADWILDFNAGQGDKVKFESFGFADFADVPLVDLSTPGNPAVQLTFIDGANVDQLTIFGVTLAQLNTMNVLVS